jgi:hypothetical protein
VAIEFFSVGQRAEGIIAIGQEATGFIAIGQIATGFFALGQMARGVIAVGQLAVGLVAVGMLAVGPIFAVAMIGAGGRGIGGVLPLLPLPSRRAKLPGLGTYAGVASGRETAWLPVTVHESGGALSLRHAEGPIDAKIAPSIEDGARTAASRGLRVLGLFGPGAGKPELRRLMRMEDEPFARGGARIGLGVLQILGLAAACWGVWEFVLVDLGDFLLTALRFLVTGQ